jgi:hypothetical protein
MNEARYTAKVDQLQAHITELLTGYGLRRDHNVQIIGIFLDGVLCAMPAHPAPEDLDLIYQATRASIQLIANICQPPDLDDLEVEL